MLEEAAEKPAPEVAVRSERARFVPNRGSLREWLVWAAVAAVVATLCLWRLGASTLEGDEALYGSVLLDSWQESFSLPLRLRSQTYLNKPPLGFVALWAGRALTDRDELGQRLPGALSGILCAALLGIAGARWFGWPGAALAAVACVATPTALSGHAFRGGTFDGLITLLLTAASLAWIRTLRSPARHSPAPWFAFALATTALKNLAGPALASMHAAASAAGVAVVERDSRPLRRAAIWTAVLLATAVALLLAFALFLSHRGATGIAASLLQQDILQRATGELARVPVRSWGFYLTQLVSDFRWVGFWAVLSILALLLPSQRQGASRLDRRFLILLVLWPLSVLLPLSLFGSKLRWYVLPAYPAVALACGAGLCFALENSHGRRRQLLAVAAIASVGAQIAFSGGDLAGPARRHPLASLAPALEREPGAVLYLQPDLAFRFQSMDSAARPLDQMFGAADYYYLRRAELVRGSTWPPEKGSAACALAITDRRGLGQPELAGADWKRTELALPRTRAPLFLVDRCAGRFAPTAR